MELNAIETYCLTLFPLLIRIFNPFHTIHFCKVRYGQSESIIAICHLLKRVPNWTQKSFKPEGHYFKIFHWLTLLISHSQVVQSISNNKTVNKNSVSHPRLASNAGDILSALTKFVELEKRFPILTKRPLSQPDGIRWWLKANYHYHPSALANLRCSPRESSPLSLADVTGFPRCATQSTRRRT